jgi:hypothetical protein
MADSAARNQLELGNDVAWRVFEINKASMQAVGKSQTRFVNVLLTYLAVLWAWQFMPSAFAPGNVIETPIVKLSPSGLWAITPAVLTVLSLSLIGSMNIMGPVWQRLSEAAQRLGQAFFWSDLDVNKNLIDYFTYLKLWPEGTVEIAKTSRQWSPYVFSYPLLLLGSVVTTFFADYPTAPFGFKCYVWICAILQLVYSFRIWYRAFCRFFGVRKKQTEV